jgi:integrase
MQRWRSDGLHRGPIRHHEEAPDLLATLRKIEARGTYETTHRAKQRCGQVFRFAIATGRAERDISADLRGALAPVVTKNRAALTDPSRVAELLRAIDGYRGSPTTTYALKVASRTFVRPGELRYAEWSEIDFDNAEWRIPAARMKMRELHIVPLARQVIGWLRELHSMTGHGFRAMASTLLNEKGWHPDVIELQLAHSERNKVRAAYNRAQRLAERRAMMQAWADYLDALAGSSRSWLRIIENHSMLEQRHHGEGCSRKTPAMSENESSSAYGVLTPLRSDK